MPLKRLSLVETFYIKYRSDFGYGFLGIKSSHTAKFHSVKISYEKTK